MCLNAAPVCVVDGRYPTVRTGKVGPTVLFPFLCLELAFTFVTGHGSRPAVPHLICIPHIQEHLPNDLLRNGGTPNLYDEYITNPDLPVVAHSFHASETTSCNVLKLTKPGILFVSL